MLPPVNRNWQLISSHCSFPHFLILAPTCPGQIARCNTNMICVQLFKVAKLMEQHALKKVNSCYNTKIYSYLVTSGG